MKKTVLVLMLIAFLSMTGFVFAQEETEVLTVTNLRVDEEGRYVGDDGYEYILIGFGFATEEDFKTPDSRCSHSGFQSCANVAAYQGGESGSACVCRNWSGTTLEAKINLSNPSNRLAQACHLVNGDTNTNNYSCTSSVAPTGSWTSSHFGYNLTPGYHVAGYKFFRRGGRIN